MAHRILTERQQNVPANQNRKRPRSPGQSSGTAATGATASGAAASSAAPSNSVPSISAPSLSPEIETAIKTVHDVESSYKEEYIRDCALKMQSQRKKITSATLWEVVTNNGQNQLEISADQAGHNAGSTQHSSLPPSRTRSDANSKYGHKNRPELPNASGSTVDAVYSFDAVDGFDPVDGLDTVDGDTSTDYLDGATQSNLNCAGSVAKRNQESVNRGSASTSFKSVPRGRGHNSITGDRPQAASLTTSQVTQGSDMRRISSGSSQISASSGRGFESSTESSIEDVSFDIDKVPEVRVEFGLTGKDEDNVETDAEPDVTAELKEKQGYDSSSSKDLAVAMITEGARRLHLLLELVTKEHELLEKSRKCIECQKKPRDITFLPCGHFTVCSACAEPRYICQTCNNTILGTVTTYLS